MIMTSKVREVIGKLMQAHADTGGVVGFVLGSTDTMQTIVEDREVARLQRATGMDRPAVAWAPLSIESAMLAGVLQPDQAGMVREMIEGKVKGNGNKGE